MHSLLTEYGRQCGVVPSLRKDYRYTIAAKVFFNWQTEDGRWLEGEGTTKDMSGNGLFVLTDTVPEAGASIRVTVVMPALKVLQPIAFHGYGKVVRIESEAGWLFGFAAAVTFDDTNNYCSGDEVRLDQELFMRLAQAADSSIIGLCARMGGLATPLGSFTQ